MKEPQRLWRHSSTTYGLESRTQIRQRPRARCRHIYVQSHDDVKVALHRYEKNHLHLQILVESFQNDCEAVPEDTGRPIRVCPMLPHDAPSCKAVVGKKDPIHALVLYH